MNLQSRSGMDDRAHWRCFFSVLTYVIAVAAVGGCGPRETVVIDAPAGVAELQKIGAAYDAATQKLKRPPKNLEELAPFLKELGDPSLTSPNDKQLYVIIYGVGGEAKSLDPPVIAYEKLGVDGKRWVLRGYGAVGPMTDEQFKKAKFPAGHKPPD